MQVHTKDMTIMFLQEKNKNPAFASNHIVVKEMENFANKSQKVLVAAVDYSKLVQTTE